MEVTPDPAEPLPVTPDERAALGVRVIAGVMIVAGACLAVHDILDAVTGTDGDFPIGAILLLLGWGLLRRREWARGCAVALIFLPLMWGVWLLLAMGFVDGNEINLTPDPGDIGPIGRKVYAVILLLIALAPLYVAFNILRKSDVKPWFRECSDSAFIEWNPKRWKFGIGALLFLTVVVALATASALLHPAVRAMRTERWVESQDLNDPIYFPHGASPLPYDDYAVTSSRRYADGSGSELLFGVQGVGSAIKPQLDFVVFDQRVDFVSSRPLNCGVSRGANGWEVTVHKAGLPNTSFPGEIQIAEYNNNRRTISDMRITLLEFWSFHEHPDAVWSLEGLETHVEDLRKRVAERDAAQSTSP